MINAPISVAYGKGKDTTYICIPSDGVGGMTYQRLAADQSTTNSDGFLLSPKKMSGAPEIDEFAGATDTRGFDGDGYVRAWRNMEGR